MSTHSKIGASSCERFWNCPGSVTVYGHLESKPSFYAAQGTAAHQIAEDHLRAKIELEAQGHTQLKFYNERLGDIIIVEDSERFEITVDAEMIEAVGTYVDFIDSLIEENNSSYANLQVEVKFKLDFIHEDAQGTCDAVLWFPTTNKLYVLDYKHGAGVAVEAEGNKQVLYYVTGAHGIADHEEAPVSMEGVIVQPRCAHESGTIRRSKIEEKDLWKFIDGLTSAIKRVSNGDTTLKAGSHCKFCAAKPICPEAKNEVSRLAEMDFNEVDFDEPPKPEGFTPEEIANILPRIPFIKDWCDSILAFAHSEAERGIDIPGYMLADKRSNRKWKDGVEEDLEFLLGDRMYTKKLVTPAQAEKLVGKKRAEIFFGLWEKPPVGKTLVCISEKRERRLHSAIEDFIDVDFEEVL